MNARTFQQLLDAVEGLSYQQGEQVAAALQRRSLRQQAIAIIEAQPRHALACPRCYSSELHRHGSAHGLQRYRCVPCGRTFNRLTGTPLARLRHKGKWLPYLAGMLASRTVRGAAALTGIHRNTSFRWRHRFLINAKLDRQLPLRGITEADETYLLESQKGARQLTRPARRRGGVAHKRGLSSEQVCILVARERSGSTVDFVTGRAPMTGAQLHQHLAPILASDSVLVTDGHPAYATFARRCGIVHHAVNISNGTRVDGAWHVQNVNAYHSRFKQWLRHFHGVASRYLENYLGWRWAIDGERISSAEALLRAAL